MKSVKFIWRHGKMLAGSARERLRRVERVKRAGALKAVKDATCDPSLPGIRAFAVRGGEIWEGGGVGREETVQGKSPSPP